MGWGDELLAAGQAREIHARTGKPVAIVDGAGHVRWHAAWEGLPWIVDPRKPLPREREYLANHSGRRPYCQPGLTRESGFQWSGWRVADHRPALALTEEEATLGKFWQGRLGAFIACDPIGEPRKFPNRSWGAERFAAVARLMPEIAFVQVSAPQQVTVPGFQRAPTATFREAAGLLTGARLYLGNQGGLVHAAAALGVPAVVVFGGAEPPELLGYPEHTHVVDPARAPACGRILLCGHCTAAMAAITPEAVAAAVRVALARSGRDARPTLEHQGAA